MWRLFHYTPSKLLGLLSCRSFLRPTQLCRGSGSDDPLFERYPEIDNATLGRLQAIKGSIPNDDWIATEKVHGANFGIYVMNNGRAIRYAKRSGFIEDNETFFGYSAIIPKLQDHGIHAYKLVCQLLKRDALDTVIVNGELFGGKYLHPRVARSTQKYQMKGSLRNITAVQKEMFPQYHPDLQFYAFEIKYKLTDATPPVALTFDQAQEVFAQIPNLVYQRILLRGPLDKLVAFDVESFTTTIPLLLGLGDHYLVDNRAEGIVIRHARRGLPEMEGKPTMLKIKSTAFGEMHMRANMKKPLSESRAVALERMGPQLPELTAVFHNECDVEKCQHLIDHVSDSRLTNVLSKIGPDMIVDGRMSAEKLSFLLAQDALKDFLKDGDEAAANLPLLVRREFARYVLNAAKKHVSLKWARIMQDAQNDQAG